MSGLRTTWADDAPGFRLKDGTNLGPVSSSVIEKREPEFTAVPVACSDCGRRSCDGCAANLITW